METNIVRNLILYSQDKKRIQNQFMNILISLYCVPACVNILFPQH